jgi:hypothetical protein
MAARGSSVTLPLEFRANGSPAAGVMWTLGYSEAQFASVTIDTGSSATGAQKSIQCSDTGTGRITCVAWGLNTNSIPDGQLASITFQVSNTAQGTSAPVSVLEPVAASPAADAVSAAASGGSITFENDAQLSSLTCSPASLRAPASAQCTVSLDRVTQSSVSVTLGYSAAQAAVTMPSAVTIPQGAASAPFTLRVDSAAAATTVRVTASAAGITRNFDVAVTLPVTVAISPKNVSTEAGERQTQFAATVTGASDTGVNWTLSPAVGSISSTGVYTSPVSVSSPQTVTIRATSREDTSRSDTATVVVNPDQTAPVVSAVAVNAGTTTATLTWTTDERSDTRVTYGATALAMNQNKSDSARVTQHSITLTGLLPGTTYYFRVTSTDASGNATTSPAAASAPATFRTKLGL